MLNIESKLIILLFGLQFIFGCESKVEQERTDNKDKLFYSSSRKIVGEEYKIIHMKASDTIRSWILNGVDYFQFSGKEKTFTLDSLLCFNSNGDRLVGCVLNFHIGGNADGLEYFLGEKIDGEWYFLSKDYVVIPRKMVKDQPIGKTLNYQQLHKFALSEIFASYLIDGVINEDWFTNIFEGPGWGDFNDQESDFKFLGVSEKFTSKRAFFEAIHLKSTRNFWYHRDTTKPVLYLNKPPLNN